MLVPERREDISNGWLASLAPKRVLVYADLLHDVFPVLQLLNPVIRNCSLDRIVVDFNKKYSLDDAVQLCA